MSNFGQQGFGNPQQPGGFAPSNLSTAQSQPSLARNGPTSPGFRSSTNIRNSQGGYPPSSPYGGPSNPPFGQPNNFPPMPQAPQGTDQATQNLYNCLASILTTLVQNNNNNQNQNNQCCNNQGGNEPCCPVPFIIRKVRPRRRMCGQSCGGGGGGGGCPAPCPCAPPLGRIRRAPTYARRCCPPQNCCPQNNCCPDFSRDQCRATTNPFDNKCCQPPILLVQGGRCQTIQIAELGSLGSSSGKRRKSSKRKSKSSKSSSSSGGTSSSSSSAESDDESDED